MAQSITLMGATYPDVPSVLLPKSSSGMAQFDDTTIASNAATAADIASGKLAWVNGSLLTGTGSGGGGGAYAWLGDGATKIDTKNITINLARDTSYDSWTASTTATAIKAASSSADYTLNGDFNSYDYCFVTKGFVQPVYVSGTPTTYRTHRVAQYYVTYYYGYPNSSTTSQVQTDTIGNVISLSSSSNFAVQVYYNSSGRLASRAATQCGPIYMSSYPTLSATTVSNGQSTITYKLPAFNAKCDSSRFSTTRKGQVDSANTNYSLVLEVYRVAHGKGLMSYWVTQMCNALNA